MGRFSCKVCSDKIACRAVDEELEKGMTYSGLSRLMALRGFEVGESTLSQHDRHRQPIAPAGVAKNKKDLAILVRDRVARAVENLPDEGANGMDPILEKNYAAAIKTGLSAQALIDKREARTDDNRNAFRLAVLLTGGGIAGLLAPPDLRDEDEDDTVIEGTAVELD